MNQYGPIISAITIRRAVEQTIRTWIPGYLGEAAVQAGMGRCDLPVFRSYTMTTEADHWPEDQLPACVVMSAGLVSKPQRFGDGTYRTEWSVGVASFVSARDQDSTTALAEIYASAVRALLLQQGDMGGVALASTWYDESYDVIDFDDSRTFAASMVSIGLEIDSVVDSFAGPAQPAQNPCTDPADWGTVQSTPLTTTGANP